MFHGNSPLITATYTDNLCMWQFFMDRNFHRNSPSHKNFYDGSHCGGYIDVAIGTAGGESSKVDSLLCDLAKMCMQFLQIR